MADELFPLTAEQMQGRKLKPVPSQHRFRCTPFQKKIMLHLLHGGSIGKTGNRYRVWNKKRLLLHRCSVSTFLIIKKYLRETQLGWVIDGNKIRKLRRDTWVKKYYMQMREKKQ